MKQLEKLRNRVHEIEKKNKEYAKTSIQDSPSKLNEKGTYTSTKFHPKGEDDKWKELLIRI